MERRGGGKETNAEGERYLAARGGKAPSKERRHKHTLSRGPPIHPFIQFAASKDPFSSSSSSSSTQHSTRDETSQRNDRLLSGLAWLAPQLRSPPQSSIPSHDTPVVVSERLLKLPEPTSKDRVTGPRWSGRIRKLRGIKNRRLLFGLQ